MTAETISVADGKYELTNDNGVMTAKRHGEPWSRDLVGDHLVYWMFVRIRELESALEPCPSCNGSGEVETGIGMLVCEACNGTTRRGVESQLAASPQPAAAQPLTEERLN